MGGIGSSFDNFFLGGLTSCSNVDTSFNFQADNALSMDSWAPPLSDCSMPSDSYASMSNLTNGSSFNLNQFFTQAGDLGGTGSWGQIEMPDLFMDSSLSSLSNDAFAYSGLTDFFVNDLGTTNAGTPQFMLNPVFGYQPDNSSLTFAASPASAPAGQPNAASPAALPAEQTRIATEKSALVEASRYVDNATGGAKGVTVAASSSIVTSSSVAKYVDAVAHSDIGKAVGTFAESGAGKLTGKALPLAGLIAAKGDVDEMNDVLNDPNSTTLERGLAYVEGYGGFISGVSGTAAPIAAATGVGIGVGAAAGFTSLVTGLASAGAGWARRTYFSRGEG